MNLPPGALEERLARLAEFLLLFESSQEPFGMWVGGKPMPHQNVVVPAFVRTGAAEDFLAMLRETGWIDATLDTRVWKRSDEARELTGNPEALARATAEQLSRVLTAIVLHDISDEGTLDEAHRSGLLAAIARRAAALRDEPAQT